VVSTEIVDIMKAAGLESPDISILSDETTDRLRTGMFMKAARISQFGSLDVIRVAETERQAPGPGQVLVRVKAAGVGPWDALVREGKSGIPQFLPLTLDSDISGIVQSVDSGVNAFRVGDEIYGVTNEQLPGGYAGYAVAASGMIAPKPRR
jgi:NADPH:quinone reductase-like Zn-dependent oxidoreductase